MQQNKVTLVVMAAGMGSRYGGIKQLDSVGQSGETILEFGLYDAYRAGFDDVVFIIREDLEDDFRRAVLDRLPASLRVRLAFQRPDDLPPPYQDRALAAGRLKPWGTAQAVWSARELIKNPFAVINADDFYGRDSFQTMRAWLACANPLTPEYALAGYQLKNTLSENGSVSRGICAVGATGYLTKIREHVALKAGPDGKVLSTGDQTVETLEPDTLVSMNLFGFTPAVLGQLGAALQRFLAAWGTDPKRECYLPSVVGELVDGGLATVKVLPTAESWFGVTYQADRADVARRVGALVGRGVYPRSLWEGVR